jgi:predicted regulator of Ras-like GTPase activity (Roadblock/LC7/MglB family)
LNELPRNSVGEIAVSGPNVMIGYYKDEEATKESIKGEDSVIIKNDALDRYKQEGLPPRVMKVLTVFKNKRFTNENFFLTTLGKKIGKEALNKYKEIILQHSRQRWFLTGDLGYMDDDGFVFIADRKKDMIIVGGENVYPKEVENVLTQHPSIDDAGVIGIEDPIRGELPKAYIVPKLGATIDEKDVLEYCRQHLAQYKVPRSIEVIDEIPKNVTGKILKRVLRRIAMGLPADEDEEEFDDDEELEDIDDEELEEVVEDTPVAQQPPMPPSDGMSIEEQMSMLEGGGMTSPPPSAGMSIEEQMRMLEGGGGAEPVSAQEAASVPDTTYAPADGDSFEEHLRNLVMEIPGGIAASIAGYDGIGITSFSTDSDFPVVLADAEISSILGMIRKASESLSAGEPQEAYFMSGRYGFVIQSIRSQYFVVLVVDAADLNWGLTRVQVNKIVPFIEQELF